MLQLLKIIRDKVKPGASKHASILYLHCLARSSLVGDLQLKYVLLILLGKHGIMLLFIINKHISKQGLKLFTKLFPVLL